MNWTGFRRALQQAETAPALPARVAELTAQIAALTARLAVQSPVSVVTIDGKAEHYVLKRSIHDAAECSGLGYRWGEGWRYITGAGTLTKRYGEAQHFDTAALAMQRAVELANTKFTLEGSLTDTGSWRVGHIHAVWTEDAE